MLYQAIVLGVAIGLAPDLDIRGSSEVLLVSWVATVTAAVVNWLLDAMRELAPVDAAVVPVGGWGPTLGPTRLDPAEAAEAVRRVGATEAVPVRYGTFWPTGLRQVWPAGFRQHFPDPGERFSAELVGLCPGAQAHVLTHGESVTIPGPDS